MLCPRHNGGMKRETVNYALVGSVVLLALLGLLSALFFITGRGPGSARYFAEYDDVSGVKFGSPIFFEGFRIGQVGNIEPIRNGKGTRYKVALNIRRDWPIPIDSIARLQSTGLLADVAVGIREGQSKQILPVGALIRSQGGADLFAALNELAGELTTLTRGRITPLVDNLGKRVDSITAALDENTPALIGDARSLLQRLNTASVSINDILNEKNKRALSNTLRDTEASMASVRVITQDLRGTQDQLDELLKQLNGVVTDNRPELKQTVADLTQITSALSLRIDSIAHHLESASRNVDEFSREIRKNPNRLLFTPKADKVVPEE